MDRTRLIILLATAASPALAADAADAQPGASAMGNEIIVTGRRRADDVLGDVQVLGGAELARALRPTIGETLARQPGVSVAGSGPNAAKPVVRGLSGDRIRVLTDGIGALDVSASSSDHAVAINPLIADSIEVLHGPAALIYGASAIGGVVNVIDARIPRREPKDVRVKGIAGFGSAANDKLLNGAIDVPLGGHLVAHADANWSKSDDLVTGGHILSKPLRRQAAASPDPAIQALADLRGRLPNSAGRSFEVAAALAYVDGGFNAGMSVTRRTALYGVPVRYSLDPAIEAERTRIDVEQTRYDGRIEIPLSGWLSKIAVRGGYSDYQHAEVEEDGAVGSRVFSRGGEVRIDLTQRDREGWGGISGIQYLNVRQRIIGEEQYLPPSRDRSLGVFTVQHLDRGPWRAEAGLRIERSWLSADASAVVGNPALDRRYTTLSASAGGSYAVARNWKLGLTVTRSERAPSVDELFANGPHGGNASFEVGDPGLSSERSIGLEASVRHSGPVELTATIYASHFGNFLYQAPTGAIVDDLPVYQFREGRASYLGFEVQAEARLGRAAGINWTLDGTADATRVQIKGFGPAPLIPPLRLLGGVAGRAGRIGGRIEVEHDFAQRRNAPNEIETAGFTLVNASIDWQPSAERPDLSLTFAANNIFDVEARRASSLLKDYAPIAGRDLRITASIAF